MGFVRTQLPFARIQQKCKVEDGFGKANQSIGVLRRIAKNTATAVGSKIDIGFNEVQTPLGKLGVIESAVDEVNDSIEISLGELGTSANEGFGELHTSIGNGFSRLE